MKMAFVLFEYFPFGGLQRDMLAIARSAVARGHDVTIFTRRWEGDRPAGIPVQLVSVNAGSNHQRDALFANKVTALSKEFDLRVGFNKMPGLDWYYAADGCLAERYSPPLAWLPRYRSKLNMERAVFVASAATRILSISHPQKALFQQHYGTAAQRFVDLPPGIRRDRVLPDDFTLARAQHRQGQGLNDDDTMLLFVGSGFRTKGLDRAIQMLAALPEAQLFVVGHDRSDRFVAQARRLGVTARLHFMGGQDNVPQWLWSADLLLHLAYAENTGTVLLEAAIAGLPVLTTRACGYAPYIENAMMGRVMENDALLSEMVAAARSLVEADRDGWRERGRAFAASADIYDLVEHAVSALESCHGEGL